MIYIKNIREVNKYDYDEVWAIVRNFKNPSSWMIHVPELSPSKNLFFKYLNLKNNGLWNKQTFESIYVPQFLTEMNTDIAQTKFKELIDKSNNGKNIALVCFCTDASLCHRTLVGNILKSLGTDVKM